MGGSAISRRGWNRYDKAFSDSANTAANPTMSDILSRPLVSPEVHADRRVTFRVRAPRAQEVLLKGLPGRASLPLHRNEVGIWSLTTEPLEPELYSYLFEIDGAEQLDLHNRDVKKWLSLENQFEVPGDPPLLHQRTEVPHGAIHWHCYRSRSAQCERGVFVYSPPPATTVHGTPWAVLFLLHGYGDDESAWLDVGRAATIADNLLAAGQIRPLLIVMPYGHPLPLDRTLDFDAYADPNIAALERDLQEDLEPFLAQHYPLSQERRHRAIAGLSMGGGQALAIGLNNAQKFASIGAFSAAAPQGTVFEQLSLWKQSDSRANETVPKLWIACGQDDFLLERNRTFCSRLDQRRTPYHYQETTGGHTWYVWRKYLADFLPIAFPPSVS